MDGESQIKKLDTLLFLFKDEERTIGKSHLKEMMLGKGVKIDYIEQKRYLDQLIADGLIMETEPERYTIRIEGILFQGYKHRLINEAYESTRLDKLEIELRANRTWTLSLTILIAVGTLIAAVYYSIEICNRFSPVLHSHGLYWIWETKA